MSSGSSSPFEHIEPTSKTVPVTSKSHRSAPTSSLKDVPRVSSRSRGARVKLDTEYGDPASEKATLAIIRRVLVTDNAADVQETGRGIEELLPPLTSSNDVDIQLYAFIAIVVKDCISSWYSKVTSDNTFVEEVVRIMAHCSRSLEQRMRTLDVGKLILDEIPAVLQNHIEGEQDMNPIKQG